MVSGERGMNHTSITIINPCKELGRGRNRASDLLFSSPQHYQLSYGARLDSDTTVSNAQEMKGCTKYYRTCLSVTCVR